MARLTRRDLLSGAAACGTLAAAGTTEAAAGSAGGKPPNLLFVFPDQMRGSAMGFLGEEPVLTPHLDRFASQSLYLPQCASNYPLCSPYRAMLMTGMYPARNGVLSNCTSTEGLYGCELRATDRCWSDVLRDQGYSLGYIGKWHLDAPRKPYVDCYNNREEPAWNEWCPPSRRHGFGFWYAYGTYDMHLHPMYWPTDAPRDRPVYVDQWGPEHEADLAIRYLKNEGGAFREAGKPFALAVAMNPPHMPYEQVPERYVERYAGHTWRDLNRRRDADPDAAEGAWTQIRNLRNYFAMITGVDEQFGRIVLALDQLGLAEETIVVFTSDHGNCLGCHGEIAKNVPWEESMRVPFLIRWPGRIRARRDDLLLSSPDIAPTLLDLMGFGSRVPSSMQGCSHSRLFLTGSGPRPSSQIYVGTRPQNPSWGRRGVRTERHTLVVTRRRGQAQRTELYDRAADPYQLRDIAAEQLGLVDSLAEGELLPWLRKTGDAWRPA